jgi:hypothetical protein
MGSMDMSEFAVPLSSETRYEDVNGRWQRILHEPELGARISAKALSWKRVQQAQYRSLTERILSQDTTERVTEQR